jgi:phage tail protein X
MRVHAVSGSGPEGRGTKQPVSHDVPITVLASHMRVLLGSQPQLGAQVSATQQPMSQELAAVQSQVSGVVLGLSCLTCLCIPCPSTQSLPLLCRRLYTQRTKCTAAVLHPHSLPPAVTPTSKSWGVRTRSRRAASTGSKGRSTSWATGTSSTSSSMVGGWRVGCVFLCMQGACAGGAAHKHRRQHVTCALLCLGSNRLLRRVLGPHCSSAPLFQVLHHTLTMTMPPMPAVTSAGKK